MPKVLFNEIHQEKRDAILDAALNEFSNYLFVDASINRIIKEADISRGSFYQYFENKEDIYFHLLQLKIEKHVYQFFTSNDMIETQDLFKMHRQLLEFNLDLLETNGNTHYFLNIFKNMNYHHYQQLKGIFKNIRENVFQEKIPLIDGFINHDLEMLAHLLELLNQDLLNQYITQQINRNEILRKYDSFVDVIIHANQLKQVNL